jgi:hypothetical protein
MAMIRERGRKIRSRGLGMVRGLGGGVQLAHQAAVPARVRTARHPPRPTPGAQGEVTAAAADLIPRRPTRPTQAIVAEGVVSRAVVGGEAVPPRAQDRKVMTGSPALGRMLTHAAVDAAAAAAAVLAGGAGVAVAQLRPLLRVGQGVRRMWMAHQMCHLDRPQAPTVVTRVSIETR